MNKKMNKQVALALLVAVAGAAAMPALADPPPWAPAHGYRAKHAYVYYPRGEVYYAPETRTWFWLSGSNWQAGVSLPSSLQAYVSVAGVNIQLETYRPYTQHAVIYQQYGGEPPHRDDGDHGHGRGHGKGHGKHDD